MIGKIKTHLYKILSKCFVISLIFTCTSFLSQAAIRLPHLISNGMVLQRDQTINMWGWANAGEKVSISFNGKTYSGITGTDKKWLIKVAPTAAGGPYTLTVTGTNEIVIKNVLVGDVWLCSGQSNMKFPVSATKNLYTDELAHADSPNIRQYLVRDSYAIQPARDNMAYGWKEATRQSVLEFSAVAYFYAVGLYEKYKVPIGIINASWGGTPLEAWTPANGLTAFPAYTARLEMLKDSAKTEEFKTDQVNKLKSWNENVDSNDEGLKNGEKWHDNAGNYELWQHALLPNTYDKIDALKKVYGSVWFRKEINLPAGKDAVALLGKIGEADVLYFNGIKIGTTDNRYTERKYTIPASLIKPGANVLTIRVISRQGKAGFDKADNPFCVVTGTDTVSLTGNWQYKIGISVPQYIENRFDVIFRQPSVLYNGLIAPLIPYTVKGVLWYQGEENVGVTNNYDKVLQAMIVSWRKNWGDEFPFIIVQMPKYHKPDLEPANSFWAELRAAQTEALVLPKTAISINHDLGSADNLHPLNKKDFADRLVLIASQLVYQDKQPFAGPYFQSMQIKGSQAVLSFTHTDAGLVSKNGAPLNHFAIAGADKKFVWAQAKIEGDKIIVWSDAVVSPVAVRYAWADNPESANLYNKAGLPVASFRTDSWPNLSAKAVNQDN